MKTGTIDADSCFKRMDKQDYSFRLTPIGSIGRVSNASSFHRPHHSTRAGCSRFPFLKKVNFPRTLFRIASLETVSRLSHFVQTKHVAGYSPLSFAPNNGFFPKKIKMHSSPIRAGVVSRLVTDRRTPLKRSLFLVLASVAGSSFFTNAARAQEQPKTEIAMKTSGYLHSKSEPFDRTEDVIYGRRDGHALTMDVFTPTTWKNGAGVMIIVSSDYRSNREMLALVHPLCTKGFLERGYTVFAVMHSSQPKYTVPEAIEDVRRAVRFIKTNALRYGIDREKIGVGGHSAAGHLSLMMGCDPQPGDPKSRDLVERESTNIRAVGCFCPPSDFLTMKSGSKELPASFDFKEIDSSTGKYSPVSQDRSQAIAREISPMNHVKKGGAPILIIHGDQDKVVPISQSESLLEKLVRNEVECKLIVKKGYPHYWFGMERDVETTMVKWFDKQLLGK